MRELGDTLGGYTREQVGVMDFTDAINLGMAEGLTIDELDRWYSGDGYRYRIARENAGMTRPEAAEALGITFTRLHQIEVAQDEPDANEIRAMAVLYRTSADVLLGM